MSAIQSIQNFCKALLHRYPNEK